jgi:putative colanic acid biosysnthesis UDP-glucose lipid carrier transferase
MQLKSGILRDYSSLLDIILRLMDPLAVIGVTLLLGQSLTAPPELYKIFAIYGSILTVFFFPFCGLYRSWRGVSLFPELKKLITAWGLVLLSFNILILLLADPAQRSILWPYGLLLLPQFWAWAGFCLVSLIFLHMGVQYSLRTLRRMGRNSRSAVILGAGDLGEKLIGVIQENHWIGYRVLGFFDDDPQKVGTKIGGVAVRNTLEKAAAFVNLRGVDDVFIALPLRNENRIREVFSMLGDTTTNVYLLPDVFNFHLLQLNMTELAGLPLINLNGTPLNGTSNNLIKWVEDKVLALVILILISPLLVLIAAMVKLSSPGPVFFKQRRYGAKGEEVVIYKFRSMSVCEDGREVPQARKCDPRVTKIGAFLRRTSLDELPQFINVLQGRMSIVGPRPHAIAHNEQYRKIIGSYMLRHRAKPGITGWAQINGWRGETDTLEKMERRVEHDLFYLANWSFWLDLRIIILTIFKGFIGKNAY